MGLSAKEPVCGLCGLGMSELTTGSQERVSIPREAGEHCVGFLASKLDITLQLNHHLQQGLLLLPHSAGDEGSLQLAQIHTAGVKCHPKG